MSVKNALGWAKTTGGFVTVLAVSAIGGVGGAVFVTSNNAPTVPALVVVRQVADTSTPTVTATVDPTVAPVVAPTTAAPAPVESVPAPAPVVAPTSKAPVAAPVQSPAPAQSSPASVPSMVVPRGPDCSREIVNPDGSISYIPLPIDMSSGKPVCVKP